MRGWVRGRMRGGVGGLERSNDIGPKGGCKGGLEKSLVKI